MLPAEYKQLIGALSDLRDKVGATEALVVDAQGIVWGCSHTLLEEEGLDRLCVELNHLLDALPKSLARGGKVPGATLSVAGPAFYRSFAGIYLLGLWFPAPFVELSVRAAVRDAMPRIEGLVLALPPPDPESGQGVAARKA